MFLQILGTAYFIQIRFLRALGLSLGAFGVSLMATERGVPWGLPGALGGCIVDFRRFLGLWGVPGSLRAPRGL